MQQNRSLYYNAIRIMKRLFISRRKAKTRTINKDNKSFPLVLTPVMRGNIDGYRSGILTGWVFDPARPDFVIGLEIRIGDEVLSRHRADRFRYDLKALGMGGGDHGFVITLDLETRRRARLPGAVLKVQTIDEPVIVVGQISLCEAPLPDAMRAIPQALIQRVCGMAAASIRGAYTVEASVDAADSGAAIYLRLLRSKDAGIFTLPLESRLRLSPYADQLRSRLRAADHFVDGADRDHFYRWYMDSYGRDRFPRRAPFSAEEIAYLNEPICIGGLKHALSRACLWYALDDDVVRGSLDLTSDTGFRRVAYWWACQKAPELHVEDCFVSQRQISFLQSVSTNQRRDFLPLSQFAEEAILQSPNLSWVTDVGETQTRIGAYFVMLLEAAQEPGRLRFIPKEVLDYFLEGPTPQFDVVLAAACERQLAGVELDRTAYLQLVATSGFDLARLRFRTVTGEGHRIDAAQWGVPAPSQGEPFVQVVAPFSKSSGLATAGRSTRTILQQSGIPSRFANFILDNPQPDAVGDEHSAEPAAGAAINIVHLNPDLLPLAFAYGPDVYTGAYNIGFFFWELDQIAKCHQLALELVDEIWVSSEYNRRCFAKATDKPVRNMGLALLDAVPIEPARDRAVLDEMFGTTPENFVFLASYDSFSYTARKNPVAVVQAFRTAFPNDQSVRLIIKTHNGGVIDDPITIKAWQLIMNACGADPRIAVLDRTLTHAKVLSLISGADCYVSLHRSEGFGLGMLEAMQRRTPVVCTGYSGNLDFCTPETAWLVDYDEIPVLPGQYAYAEPQHVWAEPRQESAVQALRSVRFDAGERLRRVVNAALLIRDHYQAENVMPRYRQRLESLLAVRRRKV